METKQIINGLLDRADRVADQSAGRIMKRAAKRLEELEQRLFVQRELADKQRWISVTERLPEAPDRYLCNVKSFAFPGRFYCAILQYDKHGFREGNIYTDDVTHWMPLPKPPKEVE